MTSGELIRQARLTAGLSQAELAERVHLPRQQIVRWEGDSVEPGLSSFDLSLSLVPYTPDLEREARLDAIGRQTPQERLARLLKQLDR